VVVYLELERCAVPAWGSPTELEVDKPTVDVIRLLTFVQISWYNSFSTVGEHQLSTCWIHGRDVAPDLDVTVERHIYPGRPTEDVGCDAGYGGLNPS
jgi:hypothetical protein